MCIISYKAAEAQFPSKKTLQRCFAHNPDGAGFMYTASGVVHIKKGFTSFQQFWKTLRKVREEEGDNIPYVMHFRISTQAGARPDCTHPFPLSKHMKDLRLLDTTAKFGIAHNGIISLTSDHYSKTITYSDTMKFITDYLALIIKSKRWYADDDKIELIKRLMGSSRLAVLDSEGHCELLGTGWVQDNGIWYSNSTYKEPKKTTYSYAPYYWDSDWHTWSKKATPVEKYITQTTTEKDDYIDKIYDDAEENYDPYTGKYNLDPATCPETLLIDDAYCFECTRYNKCYGVSGTTEFSTLFDYDDEKEVVAT